MVELMGPRRMQAYQQAMEDEVASMFSSVYENYSVGDIEVKAHLHAKYHLEYIT